MYIISLGHRVAFHMDFPCAVRLFGLQSPHPRAVNTSLSLSLSLPVCRPRSLCGGAPCLFESFVAASVDAVLSVSLSVGPSVGGLDFYLPTVSGILSFLFSSRGETGLVAPPEHTRPRSRQTQSTFLLLPSEIATASTGCRIFDSNDHGNNNGGGW